MPGSGHWIGDENPEFVANRIGEFFGEVSESVSAAGLGN